MLKKIASAVAIPFVLITSFWFVGCGSEAPTATPSASSTASAEPTLTPPPVVETFGSPDASLMEALEEAGASWPEDFPVASEEQFWRLIGDGIELRSVADADNEVVVMYDGGGLSFTFEAGRFYVED